MRVAIFMNDDLTSNIILAPLFNTPEIEIVSIKVAVGPLSRASSQIAGALGLIRRMDFRYWLFLVLSNGLFKVFEAATLLFRLKPRSGPFVSLRALARDRSLSVTRTSAFSSAEVIAELEEKKVDLLVIRVGAILKADLLTIPRLGTWCVHSSLLPAFGGIAGELHALRTPDAPIGSTIFEVTPKLDEGPPLVQVSIRRDPKATVFAHILKNNVMAGELLAKITASTARGQPHLGELLNCGLNPSYFSWPTNSDVTSVKRSTAGLMSVVEVFRCLGWALRLNNNGRRNNDEIGEIVED